MLLKQAALSWEEKALQGKWTEVHLNFKNIILVTMWTQGICLNKFNAVKKK